MLNNVARSRDANQIDCIILCSIITCTTKSNKHAIRFPISMQLQLMIQVRAMNSSTTAACMKLRSPTL